MNHEPVSIPDRVELSSAQSALTVLNTHPSVGIASHHDDRPTDQPTDDMMNEQGG